MDSSMVNVKTEEAGKKDEAYVMCYQPNGVISQVPRNIFEKVLYETMKDKEEVVEKKKERDPRLVKYVTYKEGAEMYRMSEKKFRTWVNQIGAAKHISATKVIVSVAIIDDFLKYC